MSLEQIFTSQRVSQETLFKFYNSLTDLISEYLHSFRDEKHKTQLISLEVIFDLRDSYMQYLKRGLDSTVQLIMLEQESNNEVK